LKDFYRKISEIENSTLRGALCIIISTSGSTPRKASSKMIVMQDGSIFGTIGGGALEKKVREQALEAIKTKKSAVVDHLLLNELGMCCGGSVKLYIEPIMNKKKIYIFGAGHIGKSLAKLAVHLDFSTCLIDERTDEFIGFDVSQCAVIQQHYAVAIEQLDFDENTYVVVVTHDHAADREIVVLTSKKRNGYIGMVGSRRKVEIAKKMLLSSSLLSVEDLEKVDMPIGIQMNAVTPEEIAISILAKLIEVRNQTS
jgi:xanthine dehydrogenase accessory factor